MTNHALINAFRNPDIKSMIMPALAGFLMLFFYVYRKRDTFHALANKSSFHENGWNIILHSDVPIMFSKSFCGDD
jgi:hypothetical protein